MKLLAFYQTIETIRGDWGFQETWMGYTAADLPLIWDSEQNLSWSKTFLVFADGVLYLMEYYIILINITYIYVYIYICIWFILYDTLIFAIVMTVV